MVKTFFLLVYSTSILSAQFSIGDILNQVDAYDTWSENVRTELSKADNLLKEDNLDEEKVRTTLSSLDKVFFSKERPSTTTVSLAFDGKKPSESGHEISLDTAMKLYEQNVDFLALSEQVATTKALIYMALANNYRDQVTKSVSSLKQSIDNLAKDRP